MLRYSMPWDPSPPKPSAGARVIAMAVSLVGDPEKVRHKIGCSAEDFMAYCSGAQDLQWRHFDALLTLITHEQGLLIAKNRDLLNEMRQKSRDPRDPSPPRS